MGMKGHKSRGPITLLPNKEIIVVTHLKVNHCSKEDIDEYQNKAYSRDSFNSQRKLGKAKNKINE
jgi:ribosomal protein S10